MATKYKTKMSTRNSIYIPIFVRKEFNLDNSVELNIWVEDDKIILRKEGKNYENKYFN
jgi:bifunctional DNA-binding transcriptional regulator/antitoxin component of YhaV-PrlF toxin-antitoxin module